MGAHHYYLQAIPKRFAEEHKNYLAKVLEEERAWENEIPSSEFLEKIRNLLPNNTSWGDVEEFESKNEWGSDVRIWKEGNRVGDIVFRYSPVADPQELLERFLKAVDNENCLLFARQSEEVLKPDILVILEDMKKSRAYRFISNPTSVIIEASESINDKVNKRLSNVEE